MLSKQGPGFDPSSGNWIPQATTKSLHVELKIAYATTKTQCSQIKTSFKKDSLLSIYRHSLVSVCHNELKYDSVYIYPVSLSLIKYSAVEDIAAVFTTEMVNTNLLEFSGTLHGLYSEWGQVRHMF